MYNSAFLPLWDLHHSLSASTTVRLPRKRTELEGPVSSPVVCGMRQLSQRTRGRWEFVNFRQLTYAYTRFMKQYSL